MSISASVAYKPRDSPLTATHATDRDAKKARTFELNRNLWHFNLSAERPSAKAIAVRLRRRRPHGPRSPAHLAFRDLFEFRRVGANVATLRRELMGLRKLLRFEMGNEDLGDMDRFALRVFGLEPPRHAGTQKERRGERGTETTPCVHGFPVPTFTSLEGTSTTRGPKLVMFASVSLWCAVICAADRMLLLMVE